MRRSVMLVVLAMLLGVLWHQAPWRALTSAPPPPARCVRELRSPWKTEGEWLAGEVLRDLGEMTAFARDPPAFRRSPPRIQVTPGRAADEYRFAMDLGGTRVEQDVALRRFIWSPDDYAPAAEALIKAAGLRAVPPTAENELVERLLDLRAETLASADGRVSRRLEVSLTDAGAHEDAALLLLALAWREGAGRLSDTRRPLCRATAHLAMARALRGGVEPSWSGRVAEAALLTLAGRGADAARALPALAERRGAPAAWARALAVRLDDDWRRTIGSSQLERLAHYKAMVDVFGAGRAMQALERIPAADLGIPDWGRLTLTGNQTVEAGGMFAVDGIEGEIGELRRVRELLGLPPLDENAPGSAVNVPPERCVTRQGPRALGWSLWAEAFQRHAAFYVVVADIHVRRMLDLPDRADLLRWRLDARLANMTLLPVAVLRRAAVMAPAAERVHDPATIEQVNALLMERPELLAPHPWKELEEALSLAATDCAPATRHAWFASALPYGTTHNVEERATALEVKEPLERLRERSPDDYTVGDRRMDAMPAMSATPADVSAAFGRRAEYDRRVLWLMASAGQLHAEDRLPTLQRLCEVEPQDCTRLGSELVSMGEDTSAAEAYQRALDHALDRVHVTSQIEFLIRYYETHGQPQRAWTLAVQAGTIGSYTGLQVLGRALERRGRLREAEGTFVAIRDRYRDSKNAAHGLLGFYYRADLVLRDPRYRGRFAAAATSVFPSGLEAFGPDARSGPPADGVKVVGAELGTRRQGLNRNDRIVALDGHRVRTLEQLQVALSFDDAPEMALVVWRAGIYRDLKVRLVNRDLCSRLATYAAPK